MNYRLMHKNIPVLAFVLDDATCSILRILEIYHKEHIPVGISVTKGKVDRAALNEWWRGRSIPASRQESGRLCRNWKFMRRRICWINRWGLVCLISIGFVRKIPK